MQPTKQEAIRTISLLPEDVDMEGIMYQLYLLEKVRKGKADIAAGRVTSTDELKREIEQW